MLSVTVTQELYRNKVYKNAGNKDVLDQIPEHAKAILDVGCGAGDNAEILKQLNKQITCITVSASEAMLVKDICDEVIVSDIENDDLNFGNQKFDAIILSHVCEHLVNPANAITRLSQHLSEKGIIIIAIPNMAFYKNRVKLVKGDWSLQDTGPFDKTHLHFYSYHSAGDLHDQRYTTIVKKLPGKLAVPLSPLRKLIPGICKKIDRAGKFFPNMFAQQVILVLKRKE